MEPEIGKEETTYDVGGKEIEEGVGEKKIDTVMEYTECLRPSTSPQANSCEICSTKQNIIAIRISAPLNLEYEAKKLKLLSILKFPPSSVGDTEEFKFK